VIFLDDVHRAREAIAGRLHRTPTFSSASLSRLSGAEVHLKAELFQRTGSFKPRGVLTKLASLTPEEKSRGVIGISAGNHAQALAYCSALEGIDALLVMWQGANETKLAATREYGAQVDLDATDPGNAFARLETLMAETGRTLVHPFDDPLVAAGQGTVALELFEDAPELDTIVVPIGGGGLISGMATVAKAHEPPLEVIGVQAGLYPSAYGKFKGVDLPCGGDTLAEGIAVKEPGVFTSKIIEKVVDDIVLVSEADLEEAVALLLQIEKTVVEGAGAAGLAAVLAHRERFVGKTIGLVLCGGNIDTRLLANVLLRDLARSGRLARLRITLQDRPGALYRVMKEFDAHHVNIIEIYHQRIFTTLPAKGLITDIECEARDREQIEKLVEALRARGYSVSQVELN
jgi:threonine dehydratase